MSENEGWFVRLMKSGKTGNPAQPSPLDTENASPSVNQGSRQSRLTLTERRSGPVAILDLDGQLTLEHGVREVRETIRKLVERGDTRILVNYNLAYIDSAGLAELVRAYVTARNHGGTIKISNLTKRTGPSQTVISTLLAIFEAYDDEAQALASFGEQAAPGPPQATT